MKASATKAANMLVSYGPLVQCILKFFEIKNSKYMKLDEMADNPI